MHYFKVKEDLPRVQEVLGFLHGIQFDSLLDVGSGRGVFLLPLLRDFRELNVISMDILPHRVELWKDVQAGGIARQYVLVTVPSKPDDNPEHIHLFSNDDLARLFTGAKWVKFGSVLNHRFAMIAV